MQAKTTTVKLRAAELNRTVAYEVSQATKLLRMYNSGWELDDENFEFDGHEIKRRTSTQGSRATLKGKGDKAGARAARED